MRSNFRRPPVHAGVGEPVPSVVEGGEAEGAVVASDEVPIEVGVAEPPQDVANNRTAINKPAMSAPPR